MFCKYLFFVLLCCAGLYAQENVKLSRFAAGLSAGFGSEFKNADYTYTNRYIQAQLYYSFNPGKKWEYQLAVQPEVNLGRHRLRNYYFVKPAPGYEAKRDGYMQLKDIHEYILTIAFFTRWNVSRDFSLYVMGSVGPMITDADTERLTKGFAFCDVFAIGAAYRIGNISLDVRPGVRHVSNAGLERANAGFNTHNIAFGIIAAL